MEQQYTFKVETRYMTRGIQEQVPLELQIFMWHQIDKLVNSKQQIDYLQVFEFHKKDQYIEMIHRQEEPSYQKIYQLKLLEQFLTMDKVKIFVIDDLTHSTMLLAEEY